MLSALSKKIELIANVAIIVVACLLGMVLVKNHFLSMPAEQISKTQSKTQLIGRELSSLDIDWSQNRQTLILAISASCHFCSESGPFYKRLVREAKNTHLLVVLPQSVADGKQYLDRLGVPINDVKQSDLDLLGAQGTPTLILVDNKGVVIDSWIGKLPASMETEVLSKL